LDQDDAYRVMDLKALRCFWAMARHSSLTQAGIELGISEPAVSQRVRALEKYLGAKLYEARGGRVTVTPAGQRVVAMASQMFDRLEEFEQGLAAEEATGTVDVAAYDLAQLYALPHVVGRFRREYPRVRLRLLDYRDAESIDVVRRNQVDLGVIPAPIPADELTDDLVFHPWRSFPAYVLIPLGHPLLRHGIPAFRDLLRPEVLMRFPLIVPEARDRGYRRLADGLRKLGLPFNVALEVGTMEAVKKYAFQGLGIGVVAGICLVEEDRAQVVAIELPPELDASTTYGVVLRRDKYLTAPIKGLLRLFGAGSAPA
jgi:LysR family cys regulon transcriptional activator